MNIKNTILRPAGIFLSAVAMMMSSCSETEYMTYSADETGIYFNHDTLEFAFSVLPIDTVSHVINVPVQIMGVKSDLPRTFAYTIEYQMPSDSLQDLIYVSDIEDFEWAKQGEQFTIPATVTIPAGEIEGYIPVEINRAKLGGNFRDGYKYYRIVLRLKANENFMPVLSEKDQVRIVEFTNAVEQPAWYNYYGDKVWYVSRYGVWHPLKFIKMVEYFHELKDILPETYEKMVRLYGENLETMPYGDDHVYRTTFRKYVYSKMYEYFNNPANRQEILDYDPNFPFDFPDPYSID